MDRVGIKAVVEGFDQYVRDVAKMESATTRFSGATERAAQANQRSGGTLGLSVGNLTKAGLAVAGISGAAYTAANALRGGIQTGAEFERQLDKIASVSGATGSQLELLTSQARQLGRDTIFSASEVAAAQLELVKAGVAVNEVLGGALQGTLSLAAVGELNLADAARIAAQAMSEFGLTGSDVEHVADVLVATSNKGVSSVTSLGDALGNVGPIANDLGISLEDTVAFIGMLEQAGIRGAEAGTSLRRILLSLIDPTKESAQVMEDLGINAFDAQGKFVGLAKFMDILNAAIAPLDQKSRELALSIIFDSFAITGATVAAQKGGKALDDFRFATEDAGLAAEVAAQQTDNLSGDWEELKGKAEDLAITLEEQTNPALRGTLQRLSEFLDFLTVVFAGDWDTFWAGLSGPVQGFALAVAEGIDQAVGAVISGINVLIDAYNKVQKSPAGKFIPGGTIDKIGGVDLSGALRESIARGQEAALGPYGPSLQQELDYQRTHRETGGGGGRSYTPSSGGGAAKSAREEITALQAFLEDIASDTMLNQLVQQFGEKGGEAVLALVTAIETGAEADGSRLADSVDSLIDAARERGVPNADALGSELIAKVATALSAGTPEAIAEAEAAIQSLAQAIGITAADTFDIAISQAISENALIEQLGEQGAAAMQALETAIREGTPETGQALSDAVDAVLDELNSSGVKGADDFGTKLTAAMARAVREGTPEAVQAVYDLLDEINDAIRRAQGEVELTVTSFMQGVNQAIYAANTKAAAGDAGYQVIQGLIDALINGKPEAANAAADAAGGIIFELYDKLDPATAAALGAALMAALAAAITNGGQTAIDAVTAVLTDINTALANAVPTDDQGRTPIRFDAEGQPVYEEFHSTPAAGGGAEDNMQAAIDQAHRYRIDQLNRLGDAIMEALRRQYQQQYDAEREAIARQRDLLDDWADEQIDIRTAPLKAELDALEKAQDDNRLADLQRRLALAYDAKERKKIQDEIDDFLREQRKDEIRDEIDAIEQQVQDERDIKQQALDDQLAAVDDFYAKLLDEQALHNEALLMLQQGNQQAIVDLLKTYYPEWNEAGRSFGEQLIDGLNTANVAGAVQDILDLVHQTDEALSHMFETAQGAADAAAGIGNVQVGGNRPGGNRPPTNAPPVPVPEEPGEPYIGVPSAGLQKGWNFVTTGTAGPTKGSDYDPNEVYYAMPDGTYRRVGPDEVIPGGTGVAIYHYRKGTMFHPGGLAMVHKDEVLNLPRGAQVAPSDWYSQLRQALMPILASGGGGPANIDVNIDLRNSSFGGTARDNAEAIRSVVRSEVTKMGTREARHWGISR